MRILVVSDTHKNLNRFWDVFEKLKRENPVQIIVHCGDYYEDASAIRMRAGVPVTAVRGNCDGDFSGESYVILETEAGDFFVTHGHMENVGHDLQKLCYKAEEAGCIGAIFGQHVGAAVSMSENCTDASGKSAKTQRRLRRHFRYPRNRTGKRVWQDIQI